MCLSVCICVYIQHDLVRGCARAFIVRVCVYVCSVRVCGLKFISCEVCGITWGCVFLRA